MVQRPVANSYEGLKSPLLTVTVMPNTRDEFEGRGNEQRKLADKKHFENPSVPMRTFLRPESSSNTSNVKRLSLKMN
jgi:hypothetical protein